VFKANYTSTGWTMQNRPYRFDSKTAPPAPPNVLFDGTRLGLEAAMITTLSIAIPAGLHGGLSSCLGYFIRFSEIAKAEPKAFALGSFFWLSMAGILVLCMATFFGIAIPTMLYTMGLVRFSLFWLRKRWDRDKLANAIAGGILGLLFGTPCTVLVMLLVDMRFSLSLYAQLLRWPALLTIDGIVLLWFTLLPVVNIIGGVRSGIKIGEIVDNVKMHWFF
jgi:hypothetical protein